MSVEAPWPKLNGGRTRTSEIIIQLAEDYDVTVVYPCQSSETAPPSIPGVSLRAVNTAKIKPRLADRLGFLPRLGKFTLRSIDPVLKRTVEEINPEFVYWSHSYLAAVGMNRFTKLFHVVEFANLETQRSLSLSRSGRRLENKISALAEYFKGVWWEPRCARRADLCVSLIENEASTLKRYGARVILVPNGLNQREYFPSPVQSRKILTMGSWAYGPNKSALEAFLREDWAKILGRVPEMELVIAGPGTDSLMNGELSSIDGVTPLGYVDDLTHVFKDCFCFFAPATSGGGSQLKVAEAMSRHRVVVGPSFLMREISPDMPRDIVVATQDVAQCLIDLSCSPDRRHSLERDLLAFVAGRTWRDNFSPVRVWLAQKIWEAKLQKELNP